MAACSENNGSGTRTCNAQGTAYGACVLNACNSGFVLDGGLCVVQTVNFKYPVITAGVGLACAIASDQKIKCWGNGGSNTYPQNRTIVDSGISAANLRSIHLAPYLLGHKFEAMKNNGGVMYGSVMAAANVQLVETAQTDVDHISYGFAESSGNNPLSCFIKRNTSFDMDELRCSNTSGTVLGRHVIGSYQNKRICYTDTANPVVCATIENPSYGSFNFTWFSPLLITAGTVHPYASSSSSLGADHFCVVTINGRLVCWGDNRYGQLYAAGNASSSYTNSTPYDYGYSNAMQVVTSGSVTCVLLNTGRVECWGSNAWGQLGNNTTVDSPTTAVEVIGLTVRDM